MASPAERKVAESAGRTTGPPSSGLGVTEEKPSSTTTVKSSPRHSLAGATGLPEEELKRYIRNSSLGHPFLVLSASKRGDFVEGMPPCPATVFERLASGVRTWIKEAAVASPTKVGGGRGASGGHDTDKESLKDGLVLLTDFEGEQPGFGGELSVAQFLPTQTVASAAQGFIARSESAFTKELGGGGGSTTGTGTSTSNLGLLVDMRDAAGASVVAAIMTAVHVTKLIWGADGDLICLRHNKLGSGGIGEASASVVDVQLGFSTPERRLGLSKALPTEMVRKLPSKAEAMDFRPRMLNRRCLPFPLTDELTRYAMDDLHRIEAVLRARKPLDGTFKHAAELTYKIAAELEKQDVGIQWLNSEMMHFRRKYGDMRRIKAVRLLRGTMHLERAFGHTMTKPQLRSVTKFKQALKQEVSVVIPADLSFAD